MITQSIIINLIPSGVPPRIKVSQYDTGAEAIEVTLLNGAEAYEIPAGATILLTGRTSGGQVFTKKATTASGSVATFGVIDAMTASAGTAKAEVEILDGQTVLGSANFDIYVEPSPVRKDNTAESDWSDLQTMANAVVAAGKKVDDAEQVVADATDAANKANEIITAIGDNVERSETAATSAEAAQTAAEAAQGKAESAQTAAETAEQSASASATTATTKATEAETNASAAAESADAAKAWAVGPSDELTAGTDTDNAKYYAAQAKASADKAEAISDVGIATTSTAGIVKPDGDTITIDEDGTIHSVIDILTHHGAGLHNALYRGKYLGDSLTAAQSAAIRAGTFEDLYIGDYWTIGGVNYRIADFDYFYHAGDTECTTHHVVIVPDTGLDGQKMNDTNVTTGGYTGSKMYTTYMATAKNKIIAAFGSGHILNHREFLVNAVANGRPSGVAWVDSTIELMSEAMCYGGTFFEPVSDGSTVPEKYSVACKQLNLFRHRPDLISNRQNYWLRNVVSAAHFAIVSAHGYAHCYVASYSGGVRPAFPIY